MAKGRINKNKVSVPKPFENITEDAKRAKAEVKSLELSLQAVKETAKLLKSGISTADPTGNKSIKERNDLLTASKRLVNDKTTAEKKLQTARLAAIKLDKDREKAFDRFEKNRQKSIKTSIKLRQETVKEANAFIKLNKQVNNARNRFKRLSVQHGVNSKQAKLASKRYATLNARLLTVNRAARKAGGGLSFIGGIMKGGLGILSVAGAVQFLMSTFRDAGKTIADFDEGVANLAKVTNTTKEVARELAEELLKIDTRTSVNEILALAVAGGRLNLTGRELVEFTRSADKAFVALGDTLEGSAEEIAVSLGKIGANFQLEEKFGVSTAMEKVGSVLNDLGAKSKANEGRILDFTNRIAGIATQANLALPEVQALGALFDESGQSMEVAASTINRLLPAIGKDTARFAKVAGLDIKEFEELVSEKPLEALKAVAVGAKNSTKGLKGLSVTLKNYGINSARAASIVGLLSSKTGRLTELQEIANEAFEKGTSLSDEFALKNTTLTARIERLANKYDKFILSVENGEGVLAKAFGVFIDSLSDLLTEMDNFGKAFTTLTTKATTFQERFKIVANGIASLINNSILLPFRKVAQAIDAIAGTDLESKISIPQFELISTRVNALTVEFEKLSQEQIKNEKVAKKIIARYVVAGLSLLEATKAYKRLRIETRKSSEETEGNSRVIDDNGKKIERIIGLINVQARIVSGLSKRIKAATDEDSIIKLSLELDFEQKEFERLKRIVTSTIEEINKIELDLIDDQTDRIIAKEKDKNDRLIKQIETNSRITQEKKNDLIVAETERFEDFELNQAIKKRKRVIDEAALLSIAEIEQRRSGFKTEEDFEEFKAAQLLAIKRNQLQAELDLLIFTDRQQDELRREQLKAQLAGLHQFEEAVQSNHELIRKAIQFTEDLIVRSIDKRIDKSEEQEESHKDSLDKFEQAARDGNIIAKESLAEEQILADEAQRKQEKLEQKKQNTLLVTAVLKTFASELDNPENDGSSLKAFSKAVLSVGALSQFAAALPTFLDGIEDTGSHGQGVDGKGGFHSILHPHERVLTEGQNTRIGPGVSNEEVAQVMEQKRLGNLMGDTQIIAMANGVDMSGMEAKLVDVKKAIVDKPENHIELGKITAHTMEILESRKQGNRTVNNRFIVRG